MNVGIIFYLAMGTLCIALLAFAIFMLWHQAKNDMTKPNAGLKTAGIYCSVAAIFVSICALAETFGYNGYNPGAGSWDGWGAVLGGILLLGLLVRLGVYGAYYVIKLRATTKLDRSTIIVLIVSLSMAVAAYIILFSV